MPCEVCVAEAAYERMSERITACEETVRDVRQQRDECKGREDFAKLVIRDQDVQIAELRRQNKAKDRREAQLEQQLERAPSRVVWFTAGAASAALAFVVTKIIIKVSK